MTKNLTQRLKDLGQGGFDLDFDALDKVTPDARKQCAEAESLAIEALDEIERLRSSLEAIAEFRVDARHNQEDYADAMARVAKNTLNGAYAVEPKGFIEVNLYPEPQK